MVSHHSAVPPATRDMSQEEMLAQGSSQFTGVKKVMTTKSFLFEKDILALALVFSQIVPSVQFDAFSD